MIPRKLVARAAALALAIAGCGLLEEDEQAPQGGPPPPGFATEMVGAHNGVRATASPTPVPPLAPLLWSDSVATTAQAWADGCDYRHNPNLGSLSLGENIAANTPVGSLTATDIVVDGWAAEAPFYDHATNTCDTANPPNTAGTCGHYTQIVWRTTTVVGCGKRTCTTRSPFGNGQPWDFWVCDYAPPGNFIGQRPY